MDYIHLGEGGLGGRVANGGFWRKGRPAATHGVHLRRSALRENNSGFLAALTKRQLRHDARWCKDEEYPDPGESVDQLCAGACVPAFPK